MSWRQFALQLQSLAAEDVERVFARHGALAVTLSDAADNPVLEPLPGETPLWQDTCMTGLFNTDFDAAALIADLNREFSTDVLPFSKTETLEDRAWEREWLNDFRPMQFGHRLWVCPVDSPIPADGATVIWLDPGLAFGTGTHPTTALCLEQIERIDVAGKHVLDFGCGSGILAIGAVLLGARRAMAYDIDQQAITASLSNARQNGIANQLFATTNPEDLGDGYDIVVANILARPLLDLAEDIAGRVTTGGRLILSGILAEQSSALIERYSPWIRFDDPTLREEWACLSGTRL